MPSFPCFFASSIAAVVLAASAPAVADELASTIPAVAASPTAGATPQPVRLMTEQKDAALRARLPRVADDGLQALFADPHLLLYTEAEMPPAYQFWSSIAPGLHAPHYNISGGAGEPFGNGNREFPWSGPAGTHRCYGVESFRFLHLPRDEQGNVRPVVWFRKPSDDGATGYSWMYPVGAVLGEVLSLSGPDGKRHTFEVRIRRREADAWDVDVFRPFPTSEDLAARIKQLRPEWEQQPQLAAMVNHLETPRTLPAERLRDRQPRTVFNQAMGSDVLPAVGDDSLVAELLAGAEFRSCLGISWWLDEAGNSTAAPTTNASFHVVPARYDAGFVEVNRQSCLRCHDTANRNVRSFDGGREWYGRIRGSDGIFSFHPFSPGSISHNGSGLTVTMRGELTGGGIVAPYDPALHTADHYQAIAGLY